MFMSSNVNQVSSNPYTLVQHPRPPHKVSLIAKKCSAKLDSLWSYSSKMVFVTRQVLNFSAKSLKYVYKEIKLVSELVDGVVTKLKIFSIISVPFSVASLPSLTRSIIKNIKWKDVEGTALALLTITVVLSDTFDNITTFANALLKTIGQTTLEWVGTIALPLAYFMVIGGSISRFYKIHHIRLLNNELTKLQNKEIDVPTFLKRIGYEEDEKALGKLERKIGSELLELVKQIKSLQSEESLKQLKKGIAKQRAIHIGHVVASFVMLTAFVILQFVPAINFLAYFLLALSMTVKFGLQLYQDQKKIGS